MNDFTEKAIKDIGERLAELRQKQEMSLRELEKKSGIYRANLINVEKGRGNPSASTLARIANALGYHMAFNKGKIK